MNPLKEFSEKVSSTRRAAVIHIFGATKGAVADVMDAHLETVSVIFLTTCWAIGYGWFEAVIGIGALLGIPGAPGSKIPWYFFLGAWYSAYHLFFGFTVFCITFGVGLLKFNRMLYYRKRYLLFTSLASYPWALTVQDFAYFFFSPIFNAGNYSLNTHAWTCQGLNLGCVTLANPWKADIPFIIPRWYGVSLAVSAVLFFLAYRSALTNLLVTREVMKEIGFTEKTRITSSTPHQPISAVVQRVPKALTPERAADHHKVHSDGISRANQATSPSKETPPNVTQIVDQDREALKKRLRERLARQGP